MQSVPCFSIQGFWGTFLSSLCPFFLFSLSLSHDYHNAASVAHIIFKWSTLQDFCCWLLVPYISLVLSAIYIFTFASEFIHHLVSSWHNDLLKHFLYSFVLPFISFVWYWMPGVEDIIDLKIEAQGELDVHLGFVAQRLKKSEQSQI